MTTEPFKWKATQNDDHSAVSEMYKDVVDE